MASQGEGAGSGSSMGKYTVPDGLYPGVGLTSTADVASSVRGESWCPLALAWSRTPLWPSHRHRDDPHPLYTLWAQVCPHIGISLFRHKMSEEKLDDNIVNEHPLAHPAPCPPLAPHMLSELWDRVTWRMKLWMPLKVAIFNALSPHSPTFSNIFLLICGWYFLKQALDLSFGWQNKSHMGIF